MKTIEEMQKRHARIWRILYHLLSPFICRRFRLTKEDLHVDGPVFLIPNHVTAWDPLIAAMSLKDKQIYYVASEHIFRLGFVSKVLAFLVGPIARPKGTSSIETVKTCMEHFKAGHSICLFAEGEQTWDGRTCAIFPATGKLVKMSGATLVTFRIEGGYFSLPRWGKGLRKGRVYAHPVQIYSPEQLRGMSAKEINAAISRDIYEDAFARQEETPVRYRSRKRAEGLERALYLCPSCKKIGTLKSRKDRLYCSCGFGTSYGENCFFEPAAPFRTIAEWDAWQKKELRAMYESAAPDQLLFADDQLAFKQILSGHGEQRLGSGRLEQYPDRIVFRGQSIALSEIESLALVQANTVLFSTRSVYCELKTKKDINLRKYLEIYQLYKGK